MTTGFWVGPLAAPDTYELVEMLGGGGEGEVWRATLPLSDQGRSRVAVKILAGTGAADEERCWTEFGQLLRSLSHPGLVRVQEVFRGPPAHRCGEAGADGHPLSRYVVMDHVEGMTLREWTDENPDATAAARLRMLRTVASALDEMHRGTATEVPVAHGDVKPANVVVRAGGATVLVDLGLARLVDGPGTVGLTTPYAAPELRGPGPQATPEADRWAFAVTTAQVLTGEPPPVDERGFLDLDALAAQLNAHPVTRRRPILVRRILDVLRAPPEARPRALRVWLDGAVDSLSQVTGPGPGEGAPGAVDVPVPPGADGPRPVWPRPVWLRPVWRSLRGSPLLVALVSLLVLVAGVGGVAWARNPAPGAEAAVATDASTTAPSGAPVPGPPVPSAPETAFVGPLSAESGAATGPAGYSGSGAVGGPVIPTPAAVSARPAARTAPGPAAVTPVPAQAAPSRALPPPSAAAAAPVERAAPASAPAPAPAQKAPAAVARRDAVAPAEAPAVSSEDAPRPYLIKGFGGNCLDVRGPGTADGTAVQMWECNGATEMTWQVVGDEIHGFGGKCLDVRGPSTDNGTPVQMWDCNGATEMKWQVVGAQIRGFGGKCLDVRGPSTDDGTVVQLWDCNDATEELWSLQRA